MNRLDSQLHRLLAAAAQPETPSPGEVGLSPALEQQVLAAWRRSRLEKNNLPNLTPLFRLGFGLAFILAASAVVYHFQAGRFGGYGEVEPSAPAYYLSIK
jgi:hypothetical protein